MPMVPLPMFSWRSKWSPALPIKYWIQLVMRLHSTASLNYSLINNTYYSISMRTCLPLESFMCSPRRNCQPIIFSKSSKSSWNPSSVDRSYPERKTAINILPKIYHFISIHSYILSLSPSHLFTLAAFLNSSSQQLSVWRLLHPVRHNYTCSVGMASVNADSNSRPVLHMLYDTSQFMEVTTHCEALQQKKKQSLPQLESSSTITSLQVKWSP